MSRAKASNAKAAMPAQIPIARGEGGGETLCDLLPKDAIAYRLDEG